MTRKPNDMTPLPDLTSVRGAGPVRQRRPIYVDLLPPCNHACPAGENIQAWLDLAQAGKYRQAWDMLTRDNPLPAVHGRVCYHPCETSCNRGQLDASVSIHAVERFLGDLASSENWMPAIEAPASGKRVLVVGAGPSGLSAAYHLTRLGHSVEIHEAGPLPGGMLHFGIPAYRLPRADLMREIARIEAMGVRIVLNHKVTDLAGRKAGGRIRRRFCRDRRACLSPYRHPRPRRGAGAGCGEPAARGRRRGKTVARPPRGDLRRRQYRNGRGAHRATAGRGRSADRLPPRPRAYARARIRGRRGACRKASRSSG